MNAYTTYSILQLFQTVLDVGFCISTVYYFFRTSMATWFKRKIFVNL